MLGRTSGKAEAASVERSFLIFLLFEIVKSRNANSLDVSKEFLRRVVFPLEVRLVLEVELILLNGSRLLATRKPFLSTRSW